MDSHVEDAATLDRSAELYDLIYLSFKDYAAEAGRVAELLARVHPHASSVLDVACGTGEHARILIEQHGFRVDGLDLNPDFVRAAQRKCATGSFHEADMLAFDLGRQFDAVLCLFSAIGYVQTLDRLAQALTCFRRHLAPGGVAIVEPWFTPGTLIRGRVDTRTVKAATLEICRMAHVEVDGRVSRLHFEYLLGTADGIRHMREVHTLGLFTVDEMLAGFHVAGLLAEYDPEGITGRGLYVARARV